MKFSLIATIVVLALAQGCFAQESLDLEKLTAYLNDMKDKAAEMVRNQDLANQAQTFMQEGRAQLEPLVAQMQEQLKAAASNAEEQVKPLAASVQAQVQPMIENFQRQIEALMQRLAEQTKPIAN